MNNLFFSKGSPYNDNNEGFVNAGIRINEMKLLLGDPGKPDGWIPPPKVLDLNEEDFNDIFHHYITSYDNSCNDIQVRLFNLTADPFEKHNLANEMHDVVKDLTNQLQKYFKTMIPPDNAAEIIDGNPNRHGGYLSPGWCQAEP